MQGNQTDHERLLELNATYIDAIRHNDVGWFDDQVGEDFVCSNPDGTIAAKHAFLKQVEQPLTITELAAEEVKIRILGDFAIIHARTRYRNAEGHVRRGRYTDVWAKRDGRWVAIAAHVTR